MTDCYKTLGLQPNSTRDEIKKAYRKLSKKYHPDLNQGDKLLEEKFKEIQEAYDKLIKSGTNSYYDQESENAKYTEDSGTIYQPYTNNAEARELPKSKIELRTVFLVLGLILFIPVMTTLKDIIDRQKTNPAAPPLSDTPPPTSIDQGFRTGENKNLPEADHANNYNGAPSITDHLLTPAFKRKNKVLKVDTLK